MKNQRSGGLVFLKPRRAERSDEGVHAGAEGRKKPGDSRQRDRLKISLPVQVRPFHPRFGEVEDVGEVLNFTRSGIYFATCMPHYSIGMRLQITFPFGRRAPAHKKYLGVVVRLEELPRGSTGVAVRFLI
ncbi:MAG TPA: hypothetical protein VN661_10195 [Candidatus Acidoferrales bacterium]|nr:hypothetical protein [Candidatus Acidoferrales bacterium]